MKGNLHPHIGIPTGRLNPIILFLLLVIVLGRGMYLFLPFHLHLDSGIWFLGDAPDIGYSDDTFTQDSGGDTITSDSGTDTTSESDMGSEDDLSSGSECDEVNQDVMSDDSQEDDEINTDSQEDESDTGPHILSYSDDSSGSGSESESGTDTSDDVVSDVSEDQSSTNSDEWESGDEGYEEEDVYVDLDDLEDVYSDEGEGSGESDSVSGETGQDQEETGLDDTSLEETGSDENSSNVSDTTQEESSDDLSEAGQDKSSDVGDVSNGNETNENPETSEEEYTSQPEEGSEEGNTTINSTEGDQTNQTGSMNQTGEFTENQTQEGNQTFEDNETLLNETGSMTENQTNQTGEVQPGDNQSSGSVGSGTGHSSHSDNSQDETDNESFNETNLELNESVVYNETENQSVEPIQNITPVLNLSNDTNPELDELENFTIVNETPVYIDIDEINQTGLTNTTGYDQVNLTTEWFTVRVFNPDNCSLTNTSVDDVIIFSLYPCGDVYTYIPQSPSLYIDCGEGWANLTDELTTNLTCNIKVFVGNESQTGVLNESTNLTILNGTINQTVVNESKGYVCNLSTNGQLYWDEYGSISVGYDGFNLTFPLEVCNLSGNVWYDESSGVLNISGIGNLTVNVTGCVQEVLPGDGVYNITCESAVDRELIGYLSNMTNGEVKILRRYNLTVVSGNTSVEGGSQVNESIPVYDISMMLNDSGVIFYGFSGVGNLSRVIIFDVPEYNSSGVFVLGTPIFNKSEVILSVPGCSGQVMRCSDDEFNLTSLTCENWSETNLSYNCSGDRISFYVEGFSGYTFKPTPSNVSNYSENLSVLRDVFKELRYSQPSVLYGVARFTVNNPFDVSIPLDFVFDEKGKLKIKRYSWYIDGKKVNMLPPRYNGTVVLKAWFDRPNYRNPPNIDWKPKVRIPKEVFQQRYNISLFNLSNRAGPVNLTDDYVEMVMIDWAWWNSTWSHKLKININNTMSTALTDYQVKIVLNSSVSDLDFDDFNSSCKDIRFVNDDEDTELDYWVEYCNVSSEHIEVWVKIPSLPADSITTIWMYYGNDEVDSTMNGTATFIKFDDFDDGVMGSEWTPAGGTWTESGGYLKQTDVSTSEDKHIYQSIDISDFIVETLLRPDYFGSDKRMGVCAYRSSTSPYKFYNGIIQWNDATQINHLADHIRWGTPASVGFTFTVGNWYHFMMKVYANGSNTELYTKSWEKHDYEPINYPIHETWSDFSDYVVGLNGNSAYLGSGSNVSFDYFFVHKYAEEEPIVSYGEVYTCVDLSDPDTFGDYVVNVSGTYYINENTTLCPKTYTIDVGSSDKAIVINGTNIELNCEGSVIDGSDRDGIGIYSNYNQTTIKNCHVKRYGNGIMLSYSNNSMIQNSYVENNTYNGIIVDNSLDVVVNNTNASANNPGLRYSYSDNGIVNNFYSSKDIVGVMIQFSNSTTFQYSMIENSTTAGIIITGDNNTIEHNIIQYVDGKGIDIYSNSDYNTIYNNTIKFCGNGTYIESTSTNNNLTLNTVLNSSWYGLYIDSSSTSNTLNSNRFCFNNQSGSAYDYYDSDSATESNTTCDSSYPSGVCDNSCVEEYTGCVNLSDSSTWGDRVTYDSSTNTYYINDNVTLCRDTYTISTNTYWGKAIVINASDIYFDCNNSLIENTISSYTPYSYGIFVENMDNVEIRNCKVHYYKYNIYLSSCDNLNIHNNTVYEFVNAYGIFLGSVTNSEIYNNTGYSLSSGLFISTGTQSNLIYNNHFYNNGVGIGFGAQANTAYNNTFSNNNCSYNTHYGIYFPDHYSCNQTIYENNTAGDGKPIKFINFETGLTFSNLNNYSEYILCRVNNSLFYNITINNGDAKSDGFLLLGCRNITIKDSDISNVNRGAYYRFSSNNLINSTNISKVRSSGVGYDGSYSHSNGIINSILNNSDTTTSGYGIYIYGADNVTVKGSILIGFDNGIYSTPNTSSNHLFENNEIKNNDYGIYMYFAESSNFTNNYIHDNSQAGIKLTGSTHNRLIGNTINNNGVGVILNTHGTESSTDNYFENNTIQDNSGRGIDIQDSSCSDNTFNRTIACGNEGDYDVYDSDSNTFVMTMCDSAYSASGATICEYSCSGCVNLSDSFTYRGLVTYSGGRYYINGNTTLCTDSYHISNSDSYTSNLGAITFNSSHIYLDCNNSEIYGDGTSTGVGVSIPEPKSYNILRNCVVHDYRWPIVLGKNGGGAGADYNTIDNCTVYNAGFHGISVNYYSDHNIINNSLVYNVSTYDCISFFGQCNYGEVHNTIVHDCGRAGLYLTDTQQTIRNVTVYNSGYGVEGGFQAMDDIYNLVMYNISQYYLYSLYSNIYNLTLKYNDSEVGKIEYPQVTSCNVPSSQVILDPYFVSVNASQVTCLNTSANITIYKDDDTSCSGLYYYRKDGFPTTREEIYSDGYSFTPSYHTCDDDTDITTFSVSDWSGYTTYKYWGCVNLSDSSTWSGRVTQSGDTYYINDNVTLCTGTYTIDVSSYNTPAIKFNASHIYLDCNGSVIDGSDDGGYGIDTNHKDYIQIINCTVQNYYHGLHLDYTTDSEILYSSFLSSQYNGYVYASNNNIFNNSKFNSGIRGLWFDYNSDYNKIYNSEFKYNTGSSTSAGIYVKQGSDYLSIDNCTVTNNVLGIMTNDPLTSAGPRYLNITNSNISYNSKRGLQLYNPSNSKIINNTIEENQEYDVDLHVTLSGYCPSEMTNNTGSGGRPIGYLDEPGEIVNQNFSELIICGVLSSEGGDVLIENVTVNGSSDYYNNGIFIYRSTTNILLNNVSSVENRQGLYGSVIYPNLTINNSRFYNNTRNGIYLSSGHGWVIKNSQSIDNGLSGIHIKEGYDVMIKNNIIRNDTYSGSYDYHAGIYVVADDSGSTTNISIINNTLSEISQRGILLQDLVGGDIISDNIIANCTTIGPGIDVEGNSHYTQIIDNIIYNHSSSGIKIGPSPSYINISNNLLNNTRDAIFIYVSDHNTVFNNTIVSSYGGIFIYGSDYDIIFNNTIISNSIGVKLGYNADHNNITNNYITRSNDDGIYLSSDSDSNNITNNYVCRNGLSSGVDIDDDDSNIFNNNTCRYWESAAGTMICEHSCYVGCVNLSDDYTWFQEGVYLVSQDASTETYHIQGNTTLCRATYTMTPHGGPGINIANNSIYLDCNESVIDGGSPGTAEVGILLNHNYTSLYNCNITHFRWGVKIQDGHNNTVINVSTYNIEWTGFLLNNTENNSLNHIIIHDSDHAVRLVDAVDNDWYNLTIYDIDDYVLLFDKDGREPVGNLFNHTYIENETLFIRYNDSFTDSNEFVDFTLAHNRSVGKVNFDDVSASGQIILNSSNLIIDPWFISMNASDPHVGGFNSSANLTVYKNDTVPCANLFYFRKVGFPDTWWEIVHTGSIYSPGYHTCDDDTDITTFSVSDWSGYAAYKYEGCVNLSNPSTYAGRVEKIGDDYYILNDTELCPGEYYIKDTGESGVLILNNSDIILDCNGSAIIGNSSGYGIYVDGFNNTIIKNCVVKNYSKSYYVTGWAVNTTLLNDTSYYSPNALTLCPTNETNVTGFYVYDTTGSDRVIELGCLGTGIVNYNPYLEDIEFNNVVSGNYLIKGYLLVGLELYNLSLNNSYSSLADIYFESTVYNSSLDYINLTNHPVHPSYGIWSNADNLTMDHVYVDKVGDGIYLQNAMNNTIKNSVISNVTLRGLYISNSNDTLVLNSSFTYSQYGVKVDGNSHGLNITNSTMNHNQREGLWLAETATDNSIQDSTVCWNHRDTSYWYYDILDKDSNTFTSVTCTRHDPDSIDCTPCGGCVNLSDSSTWDPDDDGVNEVVNVSGTYYINEDVVLCEGTYNIEDPDDDGAVRVNSSMIFLDCDHAVLNGSGSGTGIYLNSINDTVIKRCKVYHYSILIELCDSNYNTIGTSDIRHGSKGIHIFSEGWLTHNNTVINNNISDVVFGIYLYGYNTSNNKIYMNNINVSSHGIFTHFTSNTSIEYNNLFSNSLYYGNGISGDADNIFIRNNIIKYFSWGVALYSMRPESKILFVNNTVVNNSYGFYADSLVSNMTNNNLTYNRFLAIQRFGCGVDKFENNIGGAGKPIKLIIANSSTYEDISGISELVISCSNNITIDNVTIDNTGAWNDGILIVSGSNISFSNFVVNNSYVGINTYLSPKNVSVSYGSIYNISYGILLSSVSSLIEGTNLTFTDINISNVRDIGVKSNVGTSILFKNVNITNINYTGIYIDSTKTVVENSYIDLSPDGDYGIFLGDGSENINITNVTVISENTGTGIYGNGGNNVRIENTTIFKTQKGIHFIGTTNSYLAYNNVTNSSQNGIYFDSSSTSNTLEHNYFCFNNQAEGSYYDYFDEDSNTESDTTCDTSSPSGVCDNPCQYMGCINLSDSSTFTYNRVVNVSGHYYINTNITLCTDTYHLNDPDSDVDYLGVLVVNASNIYVDFNSSVIIGNGTGEGLTINGMDNVIINGSGSIKNYSVSLGINDSSDINLTDLTLVTYGETTGSAGLRVENSQHINSSNLTVNGSSDDSYTILYLDDVDDCTFQDCYFGEVNPSTSSDYTKWWYVHNGDNLTFQDSIIYVPNITSSEISSLTNSLFTNCTFNEFVSHGPGVFLGGIQSSSFEDNTFNNVSLKVYTDVNITDNRFIHHATLQNSLISSSSGNLNVINNTIIFENSIADYLIKPGVNSNISYNNITESYHPFSTFKIFAVDSNSVVSHNIYNFTYIGLVTGVGRGTSSNVENIIISSNEFYMSDGSHGIYFDDLPGSPDLNITVEDNYVEAGGDGIRLMKVNNSTVRDNIIRGDSGIYLSNVIYTDVYNNTVNDSTTGISIQESSYLNVSDNKVNNSSTFGLYVEDTHNSTYSNNNITYSDRDGIHLNNDVSNLTFNSNYVCFNYRDSNTYYDVLDLDDSGWDDTTCDRDSPPVICENYCTPCVNLSDNTTWDPDGDGVDNVVKVSTSSGFVYYINDDIRLCTGNYSLGSRDYDIVINSSNIIFDCDGSYLIGADLYIPGDNGVGILIKNVNNTVVRNCNIKDFLAGIRLDGSEGTVYDTHIINNNFTSNGHDIQFYSDVRESVIHDNTFQETYSYAIGYYQDWITPLPEDVCSNNQIYNNTADGHRVLYYDTTVSLTDLTNVSELILCDADDSELSNVTVEGNNNNGILLLFSDHVSMNTTNVITPYTGLRLIDSDNLTSTGLTINNSKSYDLYLSGNDHVLNDTIIYDTSNGFVYYSGTNLSFNNLTIANNTDVGKVNWPNITLTSGQNLKYENLRVNNWFISLNSTAVPGFDRPANLTIYKNDTVSCSALSYLVKDGFPTTREEIIEGGTDYVPDYSTCDDATDITTFSVSDWSGYTTATCQVNVTNVTMFHVPEFYNEFYDNTNLSCRAKAVSDECETLNLTFTWYINGTHNDTWNTTVSCANDTWCETDLPVNQSYVHAGDNWTCSVKARCSCGASGWRNSTTHIIYHNNWAIIYGNTSGNITLAASDGNRVILWEDAIGKNVYVLDADASFNYQYLQALSRTADGELDTEDFGEADTSLGFDPSQPDSITTLFGGGDGTPETTTTFEIFGRTVTNVPVIYSTNSSGTLTGILWDTGGCTDCNYSGTETLVFITRVNSTDPSYYAPNDYEIRVPEQLQTQTGTTTELAIYVELE